MNEEFVGGEHKRDYLLQNWNACRDSAVPICRHRHFHLQMDVTFVREHMF